MKPNKRLLVSMFHGMKFIGIQLTLCLGLVCSLSAQSVLDKNVTLTVKNQTLGQVVSLLQKQTGANISFSSETAKPNNLITISVVNRKLKNLLSIDLAVYNIDYRIVDKQIVLFQKQKWPTSSQSREQRKPQTSR